MNDLFAWPAAVSSAFAEAALSGLPGSAAFAPPLLAPSARDVVMRDGSASLYRFRGSRGGAPLLLVPSLINRWYVLDLRAGASLVEALVGAGIDTWCLDWGVAEDEDRYLTWDDVVVRLARAARRVRRETGQPRMGVLGYCMGATVAAIHAARAPESVAAFVNLAGPVDFAKGGRLSEMVDRRWFDADAIADAGNIAPTQMQSGFVALRPTAQVAKWISAAERATDRAARESFAALERWASDNVPFPAEAYRTYIRSLYQANELAEGTHHVEGRRVELGRIECPLMTVVADRDVICPPEAALALEALVGSRVFERMVVPGGHVGAVVGSRASRTLYPGLVRWLRPLLGATG